MKKILAVLLVLLLGACRKEVDTTAEKQEKYNSYIQAIENNSSFEETSEYFKLTLAINKIGEEDYRYDVILDEPLIAMHNISMMAIAKDVTGVLLTNNICPNLGILEDDTYNLLPNQVDVSKGYPEGLIVSGTIKQSHITVLVMVCWQGNTKLTENRAFFQLTGDYSETAGE